MRTRRRFYSGMATQLVRQSRGLYIGRSANRSDITVRQKENDGSSDDGGDAFAAAGRIGGESKGEAGDGETHDAIRGAVYGPSRAFPVGRGGGRGRRHRQSADLSRHHQQRNPEGQRAADYPP